MPDSAMRCGAVNTLTGTKATAPYWLAYRLTRHSDVVICIHGKFQNGIRGMEVDSVFAGLERLEHEMGAVRDGLCG